MKFNPENFRFVSDGTWFKKGAEAIVEDGDFWYAGDKYSKDNYQYSVEEVLAEQDRFFAIFRGIRVAEYHHEPEAGTEYEDGEMCGFGEFEIIPK